SVAGVNFWEERGGQQVRQDGWVHYQDGAEEAAIVARLGWYDAHKARLLQQELIAVLRPLPGRETWLELQARFTPALDELKLGRTNFGFSQMAPEVCCAPCCCSPFPDGSLAAGFLLIRASVYNRTSDPPLARGRPWSDYRRLDTVGAS